MDEATRRMHLRAGLFYGRTATCGDGILKPLKQDYRSEEGAKKGIRGLRARKPLEAYPCPFCKGWHIGRMMTPEEVARFSKEVRVENKPKPKTPRIWELPGSPEGMTVARLGVTGEREDRWGWIWLCDVSRAALTVDPFGRLWVRADARVLRSGVEPKPGPPLPTDTAFVRWKFSPDPDRVLTLFVPSLAIKYIVAAEGDLADHSYPVREIISSVENIPTVMRMT